MNLVDLLAPRAEGSARGKIYGAVVGIVTNNQDPEKLGRVKVKFPWLDDAVESWWARIAVLMAGKDHGTFFLPEVDDEVLVIFEHGDVRFPYVVGALWNGVDTPPEKNDDGKNNIRVIKSRSGHLIRLTDEDGKEKIEIIDKSGKNSITFDTSQNTITITADKDIVLSAGNGSIKLSAAKIEVTSSGDAKISSSGMDIKASGTLNVKGSMVNIN